jgi:hypothetical protein
MYNDPEWASADEWDAYAWFGFAIAEAQTVERLLLLIAVSIRSAELRNDQHQHSRPDPQQELARWTLCRFLITSHRTVSWLVTLSTCSTELSPLAMHWRMSSLSRITVTLTKNHRLGLKKKLQTAASLFSHLSIRLESVLWPLIEASGSYA